MDDDDDDDDDLAKVWVARPGRGGYRNNKEIPLLLVNQDEAQLVKVISVPGENKLDGEESFPSKQNQNYQYNCPL